MHLLPLTKANRIQLGRAFANVPIVDIGIDCALEDQVGRAFVDSLDSPSIFMIEQGGFFSYFTGDMQSDTGRAFLKSVPRGRILMSGDAGWGEAVEAVYGDGVMPIERTHYASDSLSRDHLQQLANSNPHTPHIQRFDLALAQQVDEPYLEIQAFDSVEDFLARGIGFCLLRDGNIIGSAYSGLVSSRAIEVSIFVNFDYHRQGMATALACALLDWCLAHHIEPHWDAANPESCGLAEKLGYTNPQHYIAYFLKPSPPVAPD